MNDPIAPLPADHDIVPPARPTATAPYYEPQGREVEIFEAAYGKRLPAAPHAGDMSQVHVHLAHSHPCVALLEYIPWIKDAFVEPADIKDGVFLTPQVPGAGSTPTPDALQRYARPLS